MDMQTYSPTDPLSISLEAQEWNIVMMALHEAPMAARLTIPVINKLSQQFNGRPQSGNGKDAFAELQENLGKRPMRDA